MPTSVDPKRIRTDLDTQSRVALNDDVVKEYAEAMEAGHEFPAPLIFYDETANLYILVDGFHRFAAHMRVRPNDPITVEMRLGTLEDARWESIGANKSHGLRRTNEDKRNAVKQALLHPKGAELSNVKIAEHVGVSDFLIRTQEKYYMQKYVMLAQEEPLEDGRMVFRIKALRDFGHVNKGNVGGFIETTDNLSQKGNCWIEGDAVAAGQSKVSGDALLKDRARLDRHALATDRAVVCDDAVLTDFVSAYDDCRIGACSYLTGEAIVRDQAVVMCLSRYTCSGKNLKANLRDKAIAEGCVRLEGQIQMADNSRASGNATIKDWASLNDDVRVSSHATVQGKTKMYGKSYVGGHAVVGGKSKLYCNATVGGHAQLIDTTLSGDDYRR